ncbi:hypothetical protein ABW20_dc0108234 [Dactylellina cionopaga]|nr:hypothetical protein ABW20_dc0108234 [Dactylellina cionopaga]
MMIILRTETWEDSATWCGPIADELITRGLATEVTGEEIANQYLEQCYDRDSNFGKLVLEIAANKEQAAKEWGEPIIYRGKEKWRKATPGKLEKQTGKNDAEKLNTPVRENTAGNLTFSFEAAPQHPPGWFSYEDKNPTDL